MARATVELGRSRRGSVTALVAYSGPFFRGDPARKYWANRRRFLAMVAETGEAEVRRRIAAAPRRTAGPSYSARYVVGRTESLKGKPWVSTVRVSAAAGLQRANADGPTARRVQATLAGRRQSTVTRVFTASPRNRIGRNIGTTKGHEGRAHVFARSRTAVRKVMRANMGMLIEGLG